MDIRKKIDEIIREFWGINSKELKIIFDENYNRQSNSNKYNYFLSGILHGINVINDVVEGLYLKKYHLNNNYITDSETILNSEHYTVGTIEKDEGIIVRVFHRHGDLIDEFEFLNDDVIDKVFCVECGEPISETLNDIFLCNRCKKNYDLNTLWKLYDEEIVDVLDFNESETFRKLFIKTKEVNYEN